MANYHDIRYNFAIPSGSGSGAMELIKRDGGDTKKFMSKAKDKNHPFRLMGFGHRVYKNFDPRAKVMQKICHEVLDHLGIKDDPLLAIAVELEKIALEDEYFVEKKLYPNIMMSKFQKVERLVS